jgi:hypothetical protein
VSMRIETEVGTEVASIIYLKIRDLTGESMEGSPKRSHFHLIYLKSAFINPLIRLYKRLFPLGHRNY